MYQAVHDSALFIKTADNFVEVACVAVLITPPNRPCKQVRNLDETRSSRIYEQRDFSKISKCSPSCAIFSKAACQSLQSLFIMRIVHDNQSTVLSFPVPPQP